ncbi:hypothetical protein VNI00_000940 [Paramarasmius palmivorus]|uniref:F-box domain-containing protein n=1 Tax=Paramarasmius palmivorus TaxID=297713 RepID=A0AAW0E7Q0_9AGAR
MPMVTLFEELIDQVVEFVCLDREESVARLALLGRQWVPPTRRRLFHSLWIQAPERWEQSKKRHRQLLILLDNKHCSIHPYVRLVHISGTLHILGEASRPSHAEWLKPIFQHLPKWTSADSLRFSYIDSQTLNSNAWKQLFAEEVHDQGVNQFKKKVVDLCLYHVPFNSIDDTLSILNIVSGFPALQRLRMEPQVASLRSFPLRYGEAGISAPEYSLRQPPLLLDTLDLTQNPENPTGFPHDVFWNWLSAGSVKLRNLTLGLEGMDDAALRALARYLQCCGSLLTQFTLKAGSFDEFAIFGVQVKGRKEIRPSIGNLVQCTFIPPPKLSLSRAPCSKPRACQDGLSRRTQNTFTIPFQVLHPSRLSLLLDPNQSVRIHSFRSDAATAGIIRGDRQQLARNRYSVGTQKLA